ncbi:MAG: DUF6314 family protein, partial [Neomegalonema sp.]
VAEIDFADGRFLAAFDLSSDPAHATHDCPPDVYRGTLRPEGPEQWRLLWRVKGPRKDYMSVAVYRREKTPLPDCALERARPPLHDPFFADHTA